MNVSMILSGGSGTRFGGTTPKQYNLLLGKEVIGYSIDAMKKSAKTDAIIVVSDASFFEHLHSEYDVTCVKGGLSRNASLRRGLDYIQSEYPECKNVLISEAARPFLTAELIDLYYDYLSDNDAVITTQYITDSLGKMNDSVTYRDEYYLVQAPEAFKFGLLYDSFSADSKITATSQQLPPNSIIKKYFDYKHNIKITYPEDLKYAEQIMKLYYGERKVE